MRLLRTKIYGESQTKLVLDEFPRQQSDRDVDDPDYDPDYDADEGGNQYETPPYAILSHTWERQEVLFLDVVNGIAHKEDGFKKVTSAMAEARTEEYRYIWIDTCCIDKSSSAELSEAINSMYSWYEAAGICYAYLWDVPTNVDPLLENSAFRRSKWFRRGWTLQELLAPKSLVFYSANWERIGTKMHLQNAIEDTTTISIGFLNGSSSIESASVAMRMSWAASRRTTRLEDLAYCLMGIFSVNMPMLYGEGSRAFRRLQKEIMKDSDDHSLFAWADPDSKPWEYCGLLADSPAVFAGSGDISLSSRNEHPPYNMTNGGLRIELNLRLEKFGLYIAELDCVELEAKVVLYLMKLPSGGNQYARVSCNKLRLETTAETAETFETVETVFVRQQKPGVGNLSGINADYPSEFLVLRACITGGGPRHHLVDMACKGAMPTQLLTEMLTAHAEKTYAAFPKCFKVLKRTHQLTVALLFHSRLVILLGVDGAGKVAFDARHVWFEENFGFRSLATFAKLFDPHLATESLDKGGVRVRLDVVNWHHRGTVLHVVDVILDEVPKQKPTRDSTPKQESDAEALLTEVVPTDRRSIWQKMGVRHK